MTTCKRVLEIAVRMEAAYRRKFSEHARCTLPGTDAFLKCAVGLMSLHDRDETCPADPELFVALQRKPDHLASVHQPEKLERVMDYYAGRVHQMIQRLRIELIHELDQLENLNHRGIDIKDLIVRPSESVSPLGRFIFATRHQREDLAHGILGDVLRQHESCPLYRFACISLLDFRQYPSIKALEHWQHPHSAFNPQWEVSHN